MNATSETFEKVLEQIKADGSGVLTITKLQLGNLKRDRKAWIGSMSFKVKIDYC